MPRPFRANGPAVSFSGLIFGVFVICVFAYHVRANQPDSRVPNFSTVVYGQTGQRVDSFLTNLSAFGYSGSMLVVQNDAVILSKGFGFADIPRQVKNVSETVFDIGSFAKQFTATSILILEERGKLKVSDKLEKYFPDAPVDKRAITIEQLLSHSAGLDRDFPLTDPAGEYYEEVSRVDAVKRILAVPVISEPGKQYSYSNIGYVLLASIVETTSGIPFQDFLIANIFEPVGMHSTGFWGKKLPKVADSLIAYGYDEFKEYGDPRKWSDSTWTDIGGGEVVSTIGDLYKWCKTYESDLILSDSSRKRMFTPGLGDYGYGAYIRKTPRSTTVIEHGGNYMGYGMKLSWYKDENTVVINLTNRNPRDFGNNHVADRIVSQIVFGDEEFHMYAGDEFEFPPASSAVDSSLISEFVGTYQMENGDKFIIQQFGNDLSIGAVGQDALNILAPAKAEELENRDHLNQMTAKIMAGLAVGDSNAITQDMLRVGAKTENWNPALVTWLVDLKKEKGQINEIVMLGTIPGAYPKGDQQTAFHIVCESGMDVGMFDRVDNRIIGIRNPPRLFAEVPLRRGMDKDLVGWSITWFKGFDVLKTEQDSTGKAIEISVQNRNDRVNARRI